MIPRDRSGSCLFPTTSCTYIFGFKFYSKRAPCWAPVFTNVLRLLATKNAVPQVTGTDNQKKDGRQVISSQITKNKLQLGQHSDSYRSQGRSSRKVYAEPKSMQSRPESSEQELILQVAGVGTKD